MGDESNPTYMAADKNQVVEELTRPIVKLLLALIALFILRFIVTSLPGLGTEIPGAPITFATLAGGIITLVMVGIILNFGREIDPRIERAISGPEEVVSDFGTITKFLVFLIAIIIAYDGLASLALPFLVPDPGVWVYDVIFLLGALVPTVIIAQRMFENLEAMTDLLTQQVKSATVNEVECHECGETVRSSLDFCPGCGTEVSADAEPEPVEEEIENVCPDCGSDVDSSASFCGSCGTAVSSD